MFKAHTSLFVGSRDNIFKKMKEQMI